MDRLVTGQDVIRHVIGIREDRNRSQAETAGRASNAARDFAAVGDQE